MQYDGRSWQGTDRDQLEHFDAQDQTSSQTAALAHTQPRQGDVQRLRHQAQNHDPTSAAIHANHRDVANVANCHHHPRSQSTPAGQRYALQDLCRHAHP